MRSLATLSNGVDAVDEICRKIFEMMRGKVFLATNNLHFVCVSITLLFEYPR